MYERFTDRARKVMRLANAEAQRFNHEYIGTEHVLLGLVKEGSGVAANVLKNLDVELPKLRWAVEQVVQLGQGGDQVVAGRLPNTPRTKKLIEYAIEEAKGLNHSYVGTEHLLLGLLREEEGVAAQVLLNLGLNLGVVREEVMNLLGNNRPSEDDPARPPSVMQQFRDRLTATMGELQSNARTPALDSFGRDLVALARRTPPLTPALPADVDRVLHLLGRVANNGPVLLGDRAGVSAVLESVAVAVVNGQVPPALADARIVALMPEEVLRWEDDEQLFDRVRTVVNEAARTDGVWLVLWGANPFGPGKHARRADVLLRRRFLAGTLRVVWCQTETEYFASSHDPAFAAVTVPVRVALPSADSTLLGLRRAKGRYEKHHQLTIPDDALREAAERTRTLSAACDLLDDACAAVRLRLARSGVFPAEVVVSAADVAQVAPPPPHPDDDIPF